MGLNPNPVVPTEQVPAALSGTVYATILPALANMAGTFQLFNPTKWQDWAAFVVNLLSQALIIWAVVWFNRKAIIPPGSSR